MDQNNRANNNVATAQPLRMDAEYLDVIAALCNFHKEFSRDKYPQVNTFLDDDVIDEIVVLNDRASRVMRSIHSVFLEPYKWVAKPFWGVKLTSVFNSHFDVLRGLWLRINVIFKYMNDKVINITERTGIEHVLKAVIERRFRHRLGRVPPDMETPAIIKTKLYNQQTESKRLEITFGMNTCNLVINADPNRYDDRPDLNDEFLKLIEYESNEQLQAENHRLNEQNNASILRLERAQNDVTGLRAELAAAQLDGRGQAEQIVALTTQLNRLAEIVEQLRRNDQARAEQQHQAAEAGIGDIDETLNNTPRPGRRMAAGGGDDD